MINPKRALIAEDDLTSRRILEIVLGSWGYDVLSALNGQDALELAESPDSPDLIILDWMMPGLEGPEVTRRLRAKTPTLPKYIILLTTRDNVDDIVAGLEAGADDYITKPFDRNELKARVEVGQRVLILERSLAQRVSELESALEHVKTLQGILPICMHCHKIRDEASVWNRLEQYVEQHTEAHFSHGLCPECARKYYGDLLDERELDSISEGEKS